VDEMSALRAVIERGFGGGELEVADRIAGPTITEHEYLAPVGGTGAETLRAQISEARAQSPELTMTVEDMVVDGDRVWARSMARARHPRTGELVSFTVFDLCRFQDGRIVEHWGVPDRFALLHQLGALPPREVASS
jgi:ketosteroid isomerase-like protein